jgi:hypothetical protein
VAILIHSMLCINFQNGYYPCRDILWIQPVKASRRAQI